MKTLRMLTIGMLLAAAAGASLAAEDESVTTITVTAKRHAAPVERVPPATAVDTTVVMPTDMPEAHIDFHLAPIGARPVSLDKAAT